jgi:prepilin-type N-terminal cleavage/methylation domain-containing protein
MLGTMKIRPCRRGFTMIELMVVVALVAILLAVAAPSFVSYLARQRVEGVASELGTDLQFARSEAVQRNTDVRVTFGTGCYVVHTQPAGATATTCSQAEGVASAMGGAGGTSAVEIKTTKLRAGGTAAISPSDSLTWVQFEPVRGAATWDGTAAGAATLDITSTAVASRLRVSINQAVGRMRVCSPSGSFKGYSAC